MRILKLTLHKKAFEVMVTGEKRCEYRLPSKWILSRLRNKSEIKYVEFKNGYGANVPSFTARFIGASLSDGGYSNTYSNGLSVTVNGGDVVIAIGEITDIKNYSIPLK